MGLVLYGPSTASNTFLQDTVVSSSSLWRRAFPWVVVRLTIQRSGHSSVNSVLQDMPTVQPLADSFIFFWRDRVLSSSGEGMLFSFKLCM